MCEPTMDDLRAYIRIAQTKTNTAMMARDVRIASDVLDRFANGNGSLSPSVLKDLTEYVFQGYFTYDEASGEIVKVHREPPKPMGQRTPRYTPKAEPYPLLEGPPPPAALWPASLDAPPILANKLKG